MEYMYAALLLHKSGQAVNEENMKKVIESTGSTVDEAKVKVLVASLKDVDIDKELESATITAATPAAEEEGKSEKAKKEEKKEEKKSEAAEGLSSLFG